MRLWTRWSFFLVICTLVAAQDDEFLYGNFPPDFMWGSATAAYQTEGAWNLNGKGENIWDYMVHTDPTSITGNATGDVACDSYHLYQTDVSILKDMGVNFYRFSLSWSRILPTGRIDVVNQDGIDYYNNVINELLANGITPLITLYHWDLPQPLQEEFSGWLDEQVVDLFGDFADLAFSSFGDRVKWWITLNEPWVQAVEGYGFGSMAPQITGSGSNDYLAAHNLIKSHARAWHIYDDNYRATQQGKVGITIDSVWLEPRTNSTDDIEAAERGMQFKLGWFAHPIFTAEGDYPAVMKEYVARHSEEEGFPQSRLPEFDAAWIDYIRGTFDYFGLNHYSTHLAEKRVYNASLIIPSYASDAEVLPTFHPDWPESSTWWLRVVPWGFRKLLNYMKVEYNDVPILITENGFADVGELDDVGRVDYYTRYINELLKAVIVDEVNVIGYAAWSIIDNFEWADGYDVRFGIYHVDFEDPARPRTAKSSARTYRQIIADNGFVNSTSLNDPAIPW